MEFSTFSFDFFQQFLSESFKCVLLGCDDTFNDEGTLCSLSPLLLPPPPIVPLFQGKQMLFVVGREKRRPLSVGGASSSVTGIQKWRWLERGPLSLSQI